MLNLLFAILMTVTAHSASVAPQNANSSQRSEVVALVQKIRRADYEGDRAALKKYYEELAPYADDPQVSSSVRYWRGFAMWRRALNGFNDKATHDDLKGDLNPAIDEFEKAYANKPEFADAKIAAASCLQNLAFLYYVEKDAVPARENLEKSIPLMKDAQAAEPENPRVLWVVGAYLWNTPPERGGGHEPGFAAYEKGLAAARKQKAATDELIPNWGEPELLMNIAWTKLNQANPDIDAAENYARQALAIVPYWHYVRDILLAQIADAKAKRAGS
jgi:tetratricopeptide (TPR) repeat protein